eukprot:TRINITY_DN79700_c0_g1_i1.p1 TRINITY_DN79700_c0_g1~~TRINITY_DN79700_c0_g1_i1.p1  ORF type:complete len:422 (-),score=100.61 TRINITY_DN79700_c0_g1_i1:77-1342(-)
MMTAALTLNSPLHGAQRRRTKVLFSSKTATPELPLLEEAADQLAELDDEQLLPAAAIDTDCAFTPVTTVPGSPDNDDDQSSVGTEGQPTFVPAWLDERTPVELLYVKNTFLDYEDDKESPVDASRARAVSDFTGLEGLEAKGIREVCLSDLQLPLPQHSKLPDQDAVNEAEEPKVQYVPMWCHVECAADGSSFVTPYEIADGSEVPTYYCEGTPWLDNCNSGTFHPQACSGDAWAPWCQETASTGYYADPSSTNVVTLEKEVSELKQENGALKERLAELEAHEKKAMASSEETTAAANVAEPRTLLIKHLPAEICEQEHMAEVLDRHEFSGFYDFVYVWKSEKGCSALVNFTESKYGRRLARKLHGKTTWGSWVSDRECEVDWSPELQGLDTLVRDYQDTPGACLFQGGWPVPFAQHKFAA